MIKDEEVYSSIDDYQSSSANNHQHNDSSSSTTIDTQGFSGATNNEQTMKQITNIEYSYDGADTVKSSISLDDEYHVLNKYPITTVIQYVFYGTLLLTVLSALSLISVGQSLISLIFIGYAQFLSVLMGIAAVVLFFHFGDTVAKRRQALIFSACFTAQIIVISFVLFIVLIYWLAAGLYGAGGPFALTLFVMFQTWSQILSGALLSWRMYVHM